MGGGTWLVSRSLSSASSLCRSRSCLLAGKYKIEEVTKKKTISSCLIQQEDEDRDRGGTAEVRRSRGGDDVSGTCEEERPKDSSGLV